MGQSLTTRLITPTVQALYPENTQLCCADHWPHARVRTSLADAPDFCMTAKLIDGKAIAAEIRQAVKAKIDKRRNKNLRLPGLAVVLIGQDPSSDNLCPLHSCGLVSAPAGT